MARRRDYIDPMAFVNQQQQGGGGLKDLASLMGLLGLGEGQGEEERQSKAQQALQAYYEGQIAQQAAAGGRSKEELDIRRGELTGAAEERKAAAQERSAAEKYRQEQAAREIQAKEDLAAVNTLNQIMGSTDFTKEEKRAAAMKVNPRVAAGIQEEMAAAKKGRQEKFTTGLEGAYKGFAKDPKTIAAFLKTQGAVPDYAEMLKSADWQALNQGMPAAQPGWLSRMFGGGSERERAVAAAAKVAPPAVAGEASVSPSVVPAAPRPMAFTGYEPVVEGPIRRGYGAVREGTVGGPALPELLSKALGLAAPPSTGRGYYTPNAPIVEAPVGPPVDKVMEVAGVTDRNAAAPFVSAPGGPSAMPGVVQQPGFLENFLKQISDYGASRPERVPAERYPYPIGHGVPPPMGGPIDPRLLQP